MEQRSACARRPACVYAAIHMFGGVLLMAGIAGEIAATGSTTFGEMDPEHRPEVR